MIGYIASCVIFGVVVFLVMHEYETRNRGGVDEATGDAESGAEVSEGDE